MAVRAFEFVSRSPSIASANVTSILGDTYNERQKATRANSKSVSIRLLISAGGTYASYASRSDPCFLMCKVHLIVELPYDLIN